MSETDSRIRNAGASEAQSILAAKVAEVKANHDHIIEGGDGYSAGFHYALHCIAGEVEGETKARLQVTSEAAVEAANEAVLREFGTQINPAVVDAILEASAPHMLEACWDAAATAAIEREHTYGSAEKAKYDNPYRPTP